MGVQGTGVQGMGSHENGGWVDSDSGMRVPEQRGLQGFVIMGWIPGIGVPGEWGSGRNPCPQGRRVSQGLELPGWGSLGKEIVVNGSAGYWGPREREIEGISVP